MFEKYRNKLKKNLWILTMQAVTVLCGAFQALQNIMGAEGWPLAVTLPPSSGENWKEGDKGRCKNKQMILTLWRCEAALAFMCSHSGPHSCGQYIWCHSQSQKTLLHVLEFLSLQLLDNQLFFTWKSEHQVYFRRFDGQGKGVICCHIWG